MHLQNVKYMQTGILKGTGRSFFTHFSELYSIVKRDGCIIEDVYDHLGFMKDTNYASDIVLKPDQVSNEMRHHAKILR